VTRPDPPPAGKSLTLHVLIADLSEPLEAPSPAKILEMDKAGKLPSATRLSMRLIDENPGFVQTGGRSARRTAARGRGAPGGPPFSSEPAATESAGTQLQVTTRLENDSQVLVQLYLERPQASEASGARSETASDQRAESFTLQTTVRARLGQPLLVSGRHSAVGDDRVQTWVVLLIQEGDGE
jgi:hypothetical protein